jgi:hypothetical protein
MLLQQTGRGSLCRAVLCRAVQGSLVRGRYAVVSSGQELLDQLANATARYIGVDSNLSIPPNLGMRRVTVSRCVRAVDNFAGLPLHLN